VPEVNAPAYVCDDVPFVPPIVKVVELTVSIAFLRDVFRSTIDDVFAKTDALSDVIADAFDNVVEKLLKLVTVELKLLTVEPIFVTDVLSDKTGCMKYLFNKYIEL